MKLPRNSMLVAECPSCSERAIEGIPWAFGTKKPTFRCRSCDEQLTVSIMWWSWLALPLALVLFPAAAFAKKWLLAHSSAIGWQAKLFGGAVDLPAIFVVCTVAMSGWLYTRWAAR
jgi:hypothetical protein